ncbi:helix-turn-helix transcriptional regulator [Fortiea sp. LEGE XX443]|uniref:AraC family transcriptional regulator n=1 Tax=Fortiea sp. LEGE XX443 TaxID=1828611 RepID=UPI001880D250|nr:AraC family transcriptional regulator [Fortiea sp. LEGE XX443]MBE9003574.1 helix-turn-helix transcriptional regulator [Fortiea sp. LEGE XX443]
MQEEKILKIDFAQEDACAEVLPRSHIISSYHAKWDGIRLDIHQQPAHETPEHLPQQHIISMSLTHRLTKAERVLDGRFQYENIFNGDIAIIPANTHHISRWASDAEFILLSLEPAFFNRITLESIDLKDVEIKPHFAAPEPLIQQISLALKSELESDGLSSKIYIESLTTTLCIHLLKHHSVTSNKVLELSNDKGLSPRKLRQALGYIHENLAKDLTLAEIAAVVGMSMYHFSRLFKQSTGSAPHQYVMNCRIAKAKKLLTGTEKTIEQVSEQVGFQSQSHFTNVFRKFMGITPKAYREQVKI